MSTSLAELSDVDLIVKVFTEAIPGAKISASCSYRADEIDVYIEKVLPDGRKFCLQKCVADYTLGRADRIETIIAMARYTRKEFQLALGEAILEVKTEEKTDRNECFVFGAKFEFPIRTPVMVPPKAFNPDVPQDVGSAGSW